MTQYLFAHKFTMCFCKRHLALTIQGTCCKDKFQGHVSLNVEACRKSQSKLIRHMSEGQLVFFNLLILSRTKDVTICNRISSIDPGRHRSMEREVLTFKEYLNQPSSTKNARDLVIQTKYCFTKFKACDNLQSNILDLIPKTPVVTVQWKGKS